MKNTSGSFSPLPLSGILFWRGTAKQLHTAFIEICFIKRSTRTCRRLLNRRGLHGVRRDTAEAESSREYSGQGKEGKSLVLFSDFRRRYNIRDNERAPIKYILCPENHAISRTNWFRAIP